MSAIDTIWEVYDSYGANHAYFSSRDLAEKFITSCWGEKHQFEIYTHVLDTQEWE